MKALRIMCFATGGYYFFQASMMLMIMVTMPFIDRYVPQTAEQAPFLAIQRQMASVNESYAWPVVLAGALLILCGILFKKMFRVLPVIFVITIAGMSIWGWFYYRDMQAVTLTTGNVFPADDSFLGSFTKTASIIGSVQTWGFMVIPVIIMLILHIRETRKQKQQPAALI